VNKFVDNALAKKNVIAVVQSNSKPSHIVSDTIPINVVDQNHILEITHLITPTNNIISEVLSDLLSIQKKTSK